MTAWMSDELGKIGAAEEQSDISPRIHNSQDVQTEARGERLQPLLLPQDYYACTSSRGLP